ncbi:NAD-binding protein [Neolentinus lepideus HHB14362 ss-1]|uniref:enoyl-[acyl-carrier-protein] reductase n=1 Tax=Neolentinus lepideus HHB14362 ss-1 TaxID=1314782 RepID=A0A165VQB6_9AGAM|nr:NAD-binding protein [Neolentinus lepideus HHB14362 ss-1]
MLRTINASAVRLSRPSRQLRGRVLGTRHFSCTQYHFAQRAIQYERNGEPSSVLSTITYPDLPPPPAYGVNIKYLLSPVNPADINVIQGVYPAKKAVQQFGPSEYGLVAGNEGLAIVESLGDEARNKFGLKEGDWVIMAKQQAGTWSSGLCVTAQDIIKVPKDVGEVHAATITVSCCAWSGQGISQPVNPPTAYNMLRDFVNMEKGDWVLQNGANSAVGEAVIQIAAYRSLKTINFVRNRPNIEELKKHLHSLGATHVFTYDDLSNKSTVSDIKSLAEGNYPKLFLNCVSGKDTTAMLRLLGADATVVSYGAMSKQPLSVPTSYFIFKDLRTCGFWQSRWYNQHTREERIEVMDSIIDIIRQGKLREPEHEIVTIPGTASDEDATAMVKDLMRRVEGGAGKKVLIKVEEVQ